MQCPECGESAGDPRLKYCENCGASMPVRPATTTGIRPAVRVQRPARKGEGPAYTEEILEEEEAYRSATNVRALPPAVDPEEKTDPGKTTHYDGPRWLASVPAHSPSVVGVGLIAAAVVLGLTPFFSGVGLLGTLLALVGGALVVVRELREVGQTSAFTEAVPEKLVRREVPAVYTLVAAALTVRSLGFGFLPLLWLAGTGLLVWDQGKKVLFGPDGLIHAFEPRQLTRPPGVAALAGVVLCLGMLFLPWASRSVASEGIPDNAPVPQGPSELRVIPTHRPTNDSLYGGSVVEVLSGWDLPLVELVELALVAVLLLAALRPQVERPAWLRFLPTATVVMSLAWTMVNLRLTAGPIVFVVGLGGVGFFAARLLMTQEQ